MGSPVEKIYSKAAAGKTLMGDPTFTCRQAQENNGGVRQTMKARVSVQETRDSKPQAVKKNLWGLW